MFALLKRIAVASLALLGCLIVLPGIHVLANAFMLLAEPEYSVPKASSIVTFNCTRISAGGNTSYCDFGKDWTTYYAACGQGAGFGSCTGDFASYPKAAAESCSGFNAHDSRTWCAR